MQPVPTPRIVSDFDDDVVIGDHALLVVIEYRGIRIITAKEALGILGAT